MRTLNEAANISKSPFMQMHTCELLINIYIRGASIQISYHIAQYPAHLLLQEKMLRYQDLKTVLSETIKRRNYCIFLKQS